MTLTEKIDFCPRCSKSLGQDEYDKQQCCTCGWDGVYSSHVTIADADNLSPAEVEGLFRRIDNLKSELRKQ